MNRLIVAAAAATLLLSPLPALAGSAEDAFLAKLVGNWTGSGALTGAETGALTCGITFKAKPKGGVIFAGRCKAADLGVQTVSGAIVYDDASKQYVATGSGQSSVGVKTGSAVVFTSKLRNLMGSGTSTMKVTTTKITIDATVARSKAANKQINTHVVLTK